MCKLGCTLQVQRLTDRLGQNSLFLDRKLVYLTNDGSKRFSCIAEPSCVLQEKVAAVKQQLQQMQAKQEQQSTEIQTLKAQLADELCRTKSAVQSGAVSSRGASGLPPGSDLNDNRGQCGAANSDRAAGNGSGSTSMIRSVSEIDSMCCACTAAEFEGHLPMGSSIMQVRGFLFDACFQASKHAPLKHLEQVHALTVASYEVQIQQGQNLILG